MESTSIQQIQGEEINSPLAGMTVRVRGVVTGGTRKGFFLQEPEGDRETGLSSGIFIFSPRRRAPIGSLVEVEGVVVDYVTGENERPTTQISAEELQVLGDQGPPIEPVWLTAERISMEERKLARFLNSIEGMLTGVEAGATFVAPSNPFGDYVLLPPGTRAERTRHGGVLIDRDNPQRWYPSFRIIDYDRAPLVNVGAELRAPVVGPLNYRASSYQIAAQIAAPGDLRLQQADVADSSTRLRSTGSFTTVLTLNGFNLDLCVEDPARVHDPRRDVDDDLRAGRFAMLARAVVDQAGSPDIVALQEMQDDDGAEITDVVGAEANYAQLVRDIQALGGPAYRWVDIPPLADADGGQPGGNIRNAFLYNPARMELVADSLRRLGASEPAFEGSRKPLLAQFRLRSTGRSIAIINVHLASKRHQHGIFAPDRPGFDPRLATRVEQAGIVRRTLVELDQCALDYYVTGDFNDFEFSDTLRTMLGDESTNLLERLPGAERYDYNHRGRSQALMHGIVSKRQVATRDCDYEILHGNELIGVRPGVLGGKPTDHAYVIARLDLR